MAKTSEDAVLKETVDPKVTTGPIPGSKRIYVEGSRPDVRVPMREIELAPTGEEVNEAVCVYDTSGPYTDPSITVDVRKGLPALRRPWVLERGDVEEYEGRANKPEDDGYSTGEQAALVERFPDLRKPLRAKAGCNVTQMHYAKQGIVTPEMEFVAIRENQLRGKIKKLVEQHPG
ncbi:MAG: hypothetical protein ACYS22_11415, partial [Planctomycetota bacterium]